MLQASMYMLLTQIVFYATLNSHAAHSFFANKHGKETQGMWTWSGGSNQRNQKTILDGIQDYPGSRYGACSWQDLNGTVWIYGGKGYGLNNPILDELWSLDVEQRHWNFHHFNNKTGSEQKPPPCFGCASCSYGNRAVLFGPLGTFIFDMNGKQWTSLRNLTLPPPPRSHAAFWCDTEKGILWMFGGHTTSDNKLGDFWKFSFKQMEWSNFKPKTNNSIIPVNCSRASAWIHPSDQLYMFGGSTPAGLTTNFWTFTPETLEWRKLSGITGPDKCAGQYGTMGIASKNNFPGCRDGAATWVDKQGNMWMFGGSGFDNFSRGAFAEPGLLSDFWMYNTSSQQWVWIGGLSKDEGMPAFGDKGKPGLQNLPGPREGSVSFYFGDQLWLFGGEGHDVRQSDGLLNDLWVYEQMKITNKIPTLPTEMPGDTINISFGFRVLIALLVLALGLMVSVCACYSKEFRIFRFRRRLRPVVKYKPVKVEMMQVPQPEEHAPLEEPPSRNL